MATTSPDNIKSPDSGDQYALVQDMGALADSVQNALVKRANAYTGTTSQRTAFTSASEGTLWQDTNGDKFLWVRQSSAWVRVGPITSHKQIVSGVVNVSNSIQSFLFDMRFPAGVTPQIITQVVSPSGAAVGLNVLVTAVGPTSFSARHSGSTSTGFPVHYIAMG